MVFTCTITLNHAIGPDHSALCVNWTQDTLSVKSSATPETGVHNVFHSSMTISTHTSSTQKEYCCNARVVGTNAVSNCSSIEVLGEKTIFVHVTNYCNMVYRNWYLWAISANPIGQHIYYYLQCTTTDEQQYQMDISQWSCSEQLRCSDAVW